MKLDKFNKITYTNQIEKLLLSVKRGFFLTTLVRWFEGNLYQIE